MQLQSKFAKANSFNYCYELLVNKITFLLLFLLLNANIVSSFTAIHCIEESNIRASYFNILTIEY